MTGAGREGVRLDHDTPLAVDGAPAFSTHTIDISGSESIPVALTRGRRDGTDARALAREAGVDDSVLIIARVNTDTAANGTIVGAYVDGFARAQRVPPIEPFE